MRDGSPGGKEEKQEVSLGVAALAATLPRMMAAVLPEIIKAAKVTLLILSLRLHQKYKHQYTTTRNHHKGRASNHHEYYCI